MKLPRQIMLALCIAFPCYSNSPTTEQSLESLKIALSVEPNNQELRIRLAQLYNKNANFAEAINIIGEGLLYSPENLSLKFEYANTHTLLNKFDEALTIYQELNELKPDNAAILYNIAFTLKKLGLSIAAIPYYNRAVELNPDNTQMIFGRGLAYLMIGDFKQGWAGYEYRFIPPLPEQLRTKENPQWDGSDLQGKTILIHNAEQSFGDTLQFIRYAKLIKEKNGIVIAAVQPALMPLIKLCKYIDIVVSKDEMAPPYDVHCPIMSLPYVLQTRLDNIPSEHPYLYANETLIAHWEEKLKADKNFKIGICWQGNDGYTNPFQKAMAAQNSMPLSELAPIAEISGISIYSVQKTSGTAQLSNFPMNIITFEGDVDQSNGRFMDTAAIITHLDLVITIDTSIGHLASGLGTETWVMLANPYDWRWMLDRSDSPWYPKTRLFKQPTPGDWKTVIEEITQALKERVALQ